MPQHSIMSHTALRDEMMAVARGERPAPAHAGTPTFESVEALVHLPTSENRLALICGRARNDGVERP
jgi:hypothetical protein